MPGAETLRPPLGHIGMIVGTRAPEAVWRPLASTNPMFISGICPSGCVSMFAVPFTAPGCARAHTASPGTPLPLTVRRWKFPASSSKPSR
jgi:hypothetical protein